MGFRLGNKFDWLQTITNKEMTDMSVADEERLAETISKF